MRHEAYAAMLAEGLERAYAVASAARAKGYDARNTVEIKVAPDLPSRIEGIIGFEGLGEMIRSHLSAPTRQQLAFDVVVEICTSERFEMPVQQRLLLAVRAGLAILTDGVQVAPTEGISGVEMHRNPDGSDYVSVLYAGPIRGAGGTCAALSVALADMARRLLGIGAYSAQQSEIERYIEEIWLYDSRLHRLQYKPSDDDIRTIVSNCPVCVDGIHGERLEISAHRGIRRLDASGNPVAMSDRVRSAIGLVICEGIAAKAKSVLKHTKAAKLDWDWLNSVIKVGKSAQQADTGDETFMHELVGGRPILAYPGHAGSFRLRYGRSRLTGIAAKGFSPATMDLLGGFIATGTQLKLGSPGKGCIAMPVDSVEGPFVKLITGEALRINSIEDARAVHGKVAKILAVGDMLVSFGDFKKTNTRLMPSSYVEEYWEAELRASGAAVPRGAVSFKEAFGLSKAYGVPMHPRYTYDFSWINMPELAAIADAVSHAGIDAEGPGLFGVRSISIGGEHYARAKEPMERICIPHHDTGTSIIISGGDAQSLIASLGLADEAEAHMRSAIGERAESFRLALECVNALAPFTVRRRSVTLGARIGRPEKADERLMKPAAHALFPTGSYGGKERSITKAYAYAKAKFAGGAIELELARFVCDSHGETLAGAYCHRHESTAHLERRCLACGRVCAAQLCERCGGATAASARRAVDIVSMLDEACARLGMRRLAQVKGVKGLVSHDKVPEPVEKGLLRAQHNVHVFKDGTARFDATDAPITHFYPSEIGTDVPRLRALGYDTDSSGAPLTSDGQLVEMQSQDIVVNRRCAEHILRVSRFIDEMLVRLYALEPFYNYTEIEDVIGTLVVTLSPHTSAGVLGRVIGITEANVSLAHPYTICARRRNCDGDEDTLMLLLDALINFSRSYLPASVGGTMDAPLLLTVHVDPAEVDDEVHSMELVEEYGLGFYEKAEHGAMPGEVELELVGTRLGTRREFEHLGFSHAASAAAIRTSQLKSTYTLLKNMEEKVQAQCALMDMLCSIERRSAASGLITGHFIPDIIGNLHSFSKQSFRCGGCNAKYRRVPLAGKCLRCGGRILLTISKAGIEKYLSMAIRLAERYDVEAYTRQVLSLIKREIEGQFDEGYGTPARQFNLTRFM